MLVRVGLDAVGGGLPVSPRRGSPVTRTGDAGTAASVMDANELKRLYEQQFEEDLEPPIREDVDRRTTLGMLRASRGMAAGVLREQYHQGIWIWSDLHLGHPGTISVFGRPFEGPEDMDKRLFGVWRRTVRPDGTIILPRGRRVLRAVGAAPQAGGGRARAAQDSRVRQP